MGFGGAAPTATGGLERMWGGRAGLEIACQLTCDDDGHDYGDKDCDYGGGDYDWTLFGRSRRLGGRGQSPFSFFLGMSTLPSATLGHKTAHPPFSGTKVSYEINKNIIYPGLG